MQGAYTQVFKCMNFHMMFAHYKLPSPTPPIPNRLTAIQLPTQSLYNPVEVSSGLFNSFRLLQPNKKGGGGGGRAANTSAGTKRRPSLQAQHVSLTCSLRNTLTGVQSKDFQFVRNCATLNNLFVGCFDLKVFVNCSQIIYRQSLDGCLCTTMSFCHIIGVCTFMCVPSFTDPRARLSEEQRHSHGPSAQRSLN